MVKLASRWSFYTLRDLFTYVLGRKITYKNPTASGFFACQLQNKAFLMYALVTTWLYLNTRRGMAKRIIGEVERLLGRKPILMRQYIEDYRESWIQNG